MNPARSTLARRKRENQKLYMAQLQRIKDAKLDDPMKTFELQIGAIMTTFIETYGAEELAKAFSELSIK
jgi:hypothetical protein